MFDPTQFGCSVVAAADPERERATHYMIPSGSGKAQPQVCAYCKRSAAEILGTLERLEFTADDSPIAQMQARGHFTRKGHALTGYYLREPGAEMWGELVRTCACATTESATTEGTPPTAPATETALPFAEGDEISYPFGINRERERVTVLRAQRHATGSASISYRFASNPNGITWHGFLSEDDAADVAALEISKPAREIPTSRIGTHARGQGLPELHTGSAVTMYGELWRRDEDEWVRVLGVNGSADPTSPNYDSVATMDDAEMVNQLFTFANADRISQ